MSETFAKDAVINVLRKRYDFQSARSVLAAAQKTAGFDNKSSFSGSDVNALADAVEATGTRASEVVAALRELGAAKATKAAPKAAAAKPAAKAAEAKPAAAKPAAKPAAKKAEEKPAEKPAAKKPAAKKPAAKKPAAKKPAAKK